MSYTKDLWHTPQLHCRIGRAMKPIKGRVSSAEKTSTQTFLLFSSILSLLQLQQKWKPIIYAGMIYAFILR